MENISACEHSDLLLFSVLQSLCIEPHSHFAGSQILLHISPCSPPLTPFFALLQLPLIRSPAPTQYPALPPTLVHPLHRPDHPKFSSSTRLDLIPSCSRSLTPAKLPHHQNAPRFPPFPHCHSRYPPLRRRVPIFPPPAFFISPLAPISNELIHIPALTNPLRSHPLPLYVAHALTPAGILHFSQAPLLLPHPLLFHPAQRTLGLLHCGLGSLAPPSGSPL